MPMNPENLHIFLDCIISSEREAEPGKAEIVECVEGVAGSESKEGSHGKVSDGSDKDGNRVVWQKRIQLNGNLRESAEQFKAQMKDCDKVSPTGGTSVDGDSKPNLCCSLLIFLIGNAFAIASIVIGAIYIDECPVEPMIPIYLIVAGCASFIASSLNVIQSWGANHDQLSCAKAANRLNGLLSLFAIAWLIVGSVYTYQIWEPNYNSSYDVSEIKPKRPDYATTYVPDVIMGDDYCNKTVYLFSFISITFTYCLLMIGVMCGLCLCFCGGMAFCCGKKK